jgi:Kyakuja-Dileera-Zisupton transposase
VYCTGCLTLFTLSPPSLYRYSNMDYIFASILRHHSSKLSKVGSYDIACQWSKHLLECLKLLPALVRLRIIFCLTFVIPKLHIYGHKLQCQLDYSFHYHPGVGNTDGEGIERSHSFIGPMGTTTREMGPGSRHDTLDDGWGFWNWLKLVSLRRFSH